MACSDTGSQLNLVQNPKQSTGAWAKMTSARLAEVEVTG